MGRRRNLTFALGLAVFLVGAVVLYAATNRPNPTAEQATVLYAAASIPAGTTGGAAVRQGMVRTRSVPRSARPLGALTEVNQLSGKIASNAIPQGRVLVPEDFPQAPTKLGTVNIPADKTALAVKMTNVAGVAGYVAAGDSVDVFAVTKQGAGGASPGASPGASQAGPSVRLVMQGVEVISVNGERVASVQGKPDGPELVFLLAVTPPQAERLIYLGSFEQLYFSLVPSDQPPVASTPGSGQADALRLQ